MLNKGAKIKAPNVTLNPFKFMNLAKIPTLPQISIETVILILPEISVLYSLFSSLFSSHSSYACLTSSFLNFGAASLNGLNFSSFFSLLPI